MTNQPKILEVRDIRTVTDADGKTYQVADVLYEGAILPVSIPLYELHGVDVDRLHELISTFGPQEPPQDYRIFNRKQADGTYRPLSEFFDSAVHVDTTASPLNRVTRVFPSAEELADEGTEPSPIISGGEVLYRTYNDPNRPLEDDEFNGWNCDPGYW